MFLKLLQNLASFSYQYIKIIFAYFKSFILFLLANSQFLVLMILTSAIVLPIFWYSYEFFLVLGQETTTKAELADSKQFLAFMFFFSKSTSYREAWTILTPVLFAITAGSSLEAGIKPVSILLFAIFFCAFMASEFVSHFFEIDAAFKEQVRSSADRISLDINFNEFATYASDIGKICISSIAITLGISLVKNENKREKLK